MSTEQKRLNDAREAQDPVEEVGAVPERAAVGHGPRGLQRRRQRLGLLHPRPGALARLPVGRGRARRHLRRQAAAVLRAGAVERARPDPEGAPVRPHQQRGQPRRGREGVLLLPRQHAHALVHEVPLQVSAAGVPVPGPGRDQPQAIARGVRVRAARHRRLRRRPVLRRVRGVRQGRARKTCSSASPCTTADRRRRGCACCRRCGSATPGPGARTSRKPSLREAGPGVVQATHHELGEYWLSLRRRAGAALHREREQRAASVGPAQRVARTSRTRSTPTSSRDSARR